MREYDVNLIPSDILERETLIQRGRMWLFLGSGIVLFLFMVTMTIKIINNSISKEISELSSVNESVSEGMSQTRDFQMKEQELSNIKDKIGHISQNGPVMNVFSSIDKAINYNITLTHIEIRSTYSYNKKGITEKPSEGGYFSNTAPARDSGGRDNTLFIRGMARSNSDIAAMLAELSANNIYESVNMKYSRSGDSETGKPVDFEIECLLKNLN